MGNIVLVRSAMAGVFYGKLISRKRDTVVLAHSRRLWYWEGAASLSELANSGTSKPSKCRFPAPIIGLHTVLGVCEIIEMTSAAIESLDEVPVWTAR